MVNFLHSLTHTHTHTQSQSHKPQALKPFPLSEMSLRLKPSKSLPGLSSTALQKRLNARKDISEATPRIWREKDEPIELNDLGQVVLKLNHPLLRAVDSCNSLGDIDRVTSQLIVSGIFQNSLTASRVVKKLSSDPRTLSRAVHVFGLIEKPDALLCNLVMRGFVDSNDSDSALRFFREECMAENRVAPNHFTFPILVKACSEIGDVREGKKAHSRVVKSGFGSDSFVRNSLIRMYSVCGSVDDARGVFDEMLDWDLVSWNSMIHGYMKNGDMRNARKLFEEMPERDLFTWNTLISGYVETGFMKAAKLLFDLMPEKDMVTWNTMIDGYARTANIIDAVKTFEKSPRPRSITSWNTILALFVRIKDYNECLIFFNKMLDSREAKPNGATLVSVLNACANFSRLDRGKWVHSYIESSRIKPDALLSTSLLTMYAKCGEIVTARRVFDEIPDKTVVSWNSMIAGYGIHGDGEKALGTFFEMEEKGFLPSEATFVCVLSACGHSGMVLEGWWFFDLMKRRYRIEPRVEHYGCMVDILSRAGLVEDTEELIKKMPMEAGPAIWGSLLSACRAESNSRLGEIVAKRLIQMRPCDIGPYVMLSNVYATQGKWDRVEKVRKMLRENCLRKEEGKCATVHLCQFGTQSVMYSMLNEMGNQLKLGNCA